MDPEQVYVYNMRYCPYAERAVLVLLAKNVPFNVVNINLNFRQKKKPEWFLKETLGQVPVLLYKNQIIPESLIVCDLIDEVFPGPKLQSEDPFQRAKDKLVLEVFNRVSRNFYKCVWTKDQEVKAAAAKKIGENLKKIEMEYQKRGLDFFCGQTPGMLDWLMWPWMERLPLVDVLGATLPQTPGLNPYLYKMWKTEPVKSYGLPTEEHLKFIQQILDGVDELNYDFLLEQ